MIFNKKKLIFLVLAILILLSISGFAHAVDIDLADSGSLTDPAYSSFYTFLGSTLTFNADAPSGDPYRLWQSDDSIVTHILINNNTTTTVTIDDITFGGTGITINDGAHLTLLLNGTNTLTTGNIWIRENSTLVIDSADSTVSVPHSTNGALLIESPGVNNSGIGVRGSNQNGGDVTINGGNVRVQGGDYSSGIGSGYGRGAGDASVFGTITINGGCVNAIGGWGGAGIGSSFTYVRSRSEVGDITINGGHVNVTGGVNATGIGSGYTSCPPSVPEWISTSVCGNITISGNATIERVTGSQNAAGIGSGHTFQIGTSMCGNITISDNATIERVIGGQNAVGIGSGHGGGQQSSYGTSICGDITINGSAVIENVTGGTNSPGIGSSYASGGTSMCGDITISDDANVTATGGDSGGAGIGRYATYGGTSSYASITISDNAYVMATGGNGNTYGTRGGAGIGNGGIITIIGGEVVAKGGNSGGVGIGSGNYSNSCSIEISGDAIVTATGHGAAGIGGGSFADPDTTINISSTANVTAYSSGTFPAIHVAGNNQGDGFYVNAQFSSPMSPTTLKVYAFDDPITELRSLSLPNGYRSFAYTTGATSTQVDHIVADVPARIYVGHVLNDGGPNDGSQDISSQNTNVVQPVRLGTPMFTVSGTVTVNGNPLKDVTIEYDLGGSPETVTTDSDGYYEILSVSAMTLFEITDVTKTGYAVVETMPAAFAIAGDEEFDFTMSVTSTAVHTVSGDVTVNGYPLENVTVSYKIESGAVQTALTDSDGYYEILNVPFGSLFEITDVTKTGYEVAGTVPAAFIIEDDEDFDFTMTVTSTATHTVSGHVTVDGFSLKEVTVAYTINGASGSVETNDAGYYEVLDVPFGSRFVITGVTKTGYLVNEVVPTGGITVESNRVFDFTMDATAATTYDVTGYVMEGNNPLENVTISYTIGTGAVQTAMTDSNGYYEILNIPFGSPLQITGVTKSDYQVNENVPTNVVIIEDDEDFDFTMRIGSTSGGSGGSGSGNATVIPNRPVIPEPPEIPPEEIPPEEIPGGEPGEGGGGSGGGGSERPLESNAQTYIVIILIILVGVFLFAYRRRSEMK